MCMTLSYGSAVRCAEKLCFSVGSIIGFAAAPPLGNAAKIGGRHSREIFLRTDGEAELRRTPMGRALRLK